MGNAGISFKEVKEILMEDEELKNEYEKLKPEYERISKIIGAKTDTEYLESIPNMKESIIEGMNTPLTECTKEIE